MVISRAVDPNDSVQMTAVIAANDAPFSGLSGGGFGVAWALVAQVVGYVIQGIGLGASVYDAVKGAGEAVPAGEQATREDVGAIATELQKKFPTTSKSTWEALLMEGLGAKGPAPTQPPCPEGYLRDPATGACIEIKRAGMGIGAIPTWGWIALAGMGFLLLPKLGIMK
jgi:hypothetical protein